MKNYYHFLKKISKIFITFCFLLLIFTNCTDSTDGTNNSGTSNNTGTYGTLKNPYIIELGQTYNISVPGFQALCGESFDPLCSEFDRDIITTKFQIAKPGNYKITTSGVDEACDLALYIYKAQTSGSSLINYIGLFDEEYEGGNEIINVYLDDSDNDYYIFLQSWYGHDEIQLKVEMLNDDPVIWNDDFYSFNPSNYFIKGTNTYWDSANYGFILTDAERGQLGRIFNKKAVLIKSWEATFEILIDGDETGADGMVFSFVRDFDYADNGGSGLNFGGDGYGIEFDTYPYENSSDPDGLHIGILNGSAVSTHVATRIFTSDIRDGLWHTVRVLFIDGSISVYFDDTEMIIDATIPDFQPFLGYFGFTASTGSRFEKHEIRNINIRDYNP